MRAEKNLNYNHDYKNEKKGICPRNTVEIKHTEREIVQIIFSYLL